MHQLRYFQEIYAFSDDLYALWELKCKYILDDYVEDPSALKIYFNGQDEWLFDYLPTKVEASRFIAEASLSSFRTRFLKSCMRRGLR